MASQNQDDNFTMKEWLKMSYDSIKELDAKVEKDNSLFKEEMSQIKVHLKELNGTVARNVLDIDRNRKEVEIVKNEIGSINITLAKWGGIFVVITAVITTLINYYL